MRILYIDVDSLRPGHLGCYGYPTPTSPNIDRLAEEGVRFSNCYAPDLPCLPSRTSLFGGRFGIHHGAVSHGGTRAQPYGDGPQRGFHPSLAQTAWPALLRDRGHYTASISSFADRHGAWHIHAGFAEAIDPGLKGNEDATAISPLALDWLDRNADKSDWFLHVNYWDVHVPHQAPAKFHRASEAPPAWLTSELLESHWSRPGRRSAQDPRTLLGHPGQPAPFDSLEKVRDLYDNYDATIRYVDHQVGMLIDRLEQLGLLEETTVILSADHGECLGHLGCYGGHALADEHVAHVPMIVKSPALDRDVAGHQDQRLCYPFDVAAWLAAQCGAQIPDSWDAKPLPQGPGGSTPLREYLVVSQLAQSAQRAVRFDHQQERWLFLRSWYDGMAGLPDRMLFNLSQDPQELHDLASSRIDVLSSAEAMLDQWTACMTDQGSRSDPLDTVLAEIATFGRRHVEYYAQHLRRTGRGNWADELLARHDQLQRDHAPGS